MKLDIKNIVGYLPYSLKVNTIENELISIDVKNKKLESLFRGHLINIYEYDDVKPILRPMSDITKDQLQNFHVDFRVAFKNNAKFTLGNYMTLYESEWLYKHHFDIHDLIGQGLAIDINTLNK